MGLTCAWRNSISSSLLEKVYYQRDVPLNHFKQPLILVLHSVRAQVTSIEARPSSEVFAAKLYDFLSPVSR